MKRLSETLTTPNPAWTFLKSGRGIYIAFILGCVLGLMFGCGPMTGPTNLPPECGGFTYFADFQKHDRKSVTELTCHNAAGDFATWTIYVDTAGTTVYYLANSQPVRVESASAPQCIVDRYAVQVPDARFKDSDCASRDVSVAIKYTCAQAAQAIDRSQVSGECLSAKDVQACVNSVANYARAQINVAGETAKFDEMGACIKRYCDAPPQGWFWGACYSQSLASASKCREEMKACYYLSLE